MSSEALAWAFRQECKSSSVKFTLVALCECANYRTGRITPSIAHLTEITGQNRKTIITNIAALEAAGVIRDTGDRVGRTAQIKVYEAVLETVPKAEQSQERNSSENGGKQSQKRDTEPSLEPSSKQTQRAHELPANWEPIEFTADSKSRGVVDGWPPGELAGQVEHFIAHHRGKGSRFKDWQDAWSTWVLNSRRFGTNNGRGRIPDRGGSTRNAAQLALERLHHG